MGDAAAATYGVVRRFLGDLPLDHLKHPETEKRTYQGTG
jgi:hypothetical protein